jgi:hypothetical protein
MLRHFGYTNELRIDRSLWDDKTIKDEDLIKARSFELTNDCVVFLVTLFKSQLRERSSKFDVQSIDNVFSTTPRGSCPWDTSRETIYDSSQRTGNNMQASESVN